MSISWTQLFLLCILLVIGLHCESIVFAWFLSLVGGWDWIALFLLFGGLLYTTYTQFVEIFRCFFRWLFKWFATASSKSPSPSPPPGHAHFRSERHVKPSRQHAAQSQVLTRFKKRVKSHRAEIAERVDNLRNLLCGGSDYAPLQELDELARQSSPPAPW